jgi:hypothetical protein
MSGDKQRKKDHERKEHAAKRRQRDFEQPIAGPDHDHENEEP